MALPIPGKSRRRDRRRQGRVRKNYGYIKPLSSMKVRDETKDTIDRLCPLQKMALGDKLDSLLAELKDYRANSILVDAEFKDLLDVERHPMETDVDCIRRVIKNFTERFHSERKKVEGLEQELQLFKPVSEL
jgi:hypothetical protein